MQRLFAAAWPPADVVDELSELARAGAPGVRWLPAANWHITLRFFGEADPDEIIERLAGAALPRSSVRLGPALERLGSRLIVVSASGIDELAAEVRTATADIGQQDRRPFRGHLTLARTSPGAGSSLLGTALDQQFVVDEVTLVRSELRPTGAAYTTVARFATGASGDAVDALTD